METKESWNVSKEFIQMIFGTVVVGLLSWNVYTTQSMTIQQAVVAERVSTLQASLSNTISKNDLDSYKAVIDSRIGRVEQISTSHSTRLSNLENRLNSRPSDIEPPVLETVPAP